MEKDQVICLKSHSLWAEGRNLNSTNLTLKPTPSTTTPYWCSANSKIQPFSLVAEIQQLNDCLG